MAFLFPSFLWALAALAIPVVIHLFQLRRFKRIDFPNTRFLQAVSQRTRSRQRLKHWLVLASRLLALGALVLAFAQPYLPGNGGTVKAGQRAVSIYVDDSWSMDATNAEGRLLDQARTGAQDAIMAFSPSDRTQLLTNRFEGRQQFLLDRDEALQAAAQVEVGAYSRPLSQVIQRQRDVVAQAESPVKQVLLFTDLQRSVCDVERWTNDSTIPTTIVPLTPSAGENLSIDSVWFTSPVRRLGQAEALHVRIHNHGGEDLASVPLKLFIDGAQRALTATNAPAGSVIDTVLRFTNDQPGPHWGEVALADHPVTFDDRFHFAYRTAARLNVLLIGGADAEGDRAVRAVFDAGLADGGTDSTYAITQQDHRQVDLSAFARQDLVVLNALPNVPAGMASALLAFVRGGGSIAFLPGLPGDADRWKSLLGPVGAALGAQDTAQLKVERIDLRHPFFGEVFSTMPRNVELPRAKARFRMAVPPSADVLLRLQNGDPYLAAVPAGKGQAYLFTTPLSVAGGDLAGHALFVTSLLRMAERSRPMGRLYHVIGEEAVIPLEGVDLPSEAAPHLLGPNGLDLVPEVRRPLGGTAIALHDADLAPGPYALVLNTDTLATLALDLPRTESDLATMNVDELRTALEQRGLSSFRILEPGGADLSVRLKELDQGVKLWKWFVLAALLFLFVEIILIRLLR